eukprot:CAMPEP_0170166424 /NCGR_PEP_ID=MMETSP0040_2-20121228/64_1 /TAXON_ID=641309 /ORGANISM="Lotharella oceanica, Strain CCMP622" /LENGTH=76 /DNA_ID=CAMNT_0010404115 /DNA_START=99 /DNA_END=329 /DNA_ORIENTATION=+
MAAAMKTNFLSSFRQLGQRAAMALGAPVQRLARHVENEQSVATTEPKILRAKSCTLTCEGGAVYDSFTGVKISAQG